ncbi:MAG: hypothetical protein CL911_00180 [Deltaproteobacteria bacterium]|nr:hypothetical protein [Deltaproteobacteria bacterium]
MLALKDEVPVFYPESDGRSMAETDVHRNLIFRMTAQLQAAFPEAYVSGNICLYYERGNPKKIISPDALLCRSQPPGEKHVYLAWEDRAQLDLVMEFSSFSTRREDHHKKKRIYEQILKVPYYVIFDPHAVYLTVYELGAQDYRQLETDEQGHCHLPGLQLRVALEDANVLRLFDVHGQPVWTTEELSLHEKQLALEEKEQALAEQERLRNLLKAAGVAPGA